MFRVLIADDEERICQLIQALGEWDRLGLEVVGTAGNGPDTLEMIRRLEPHILITDIRMPGCDGLQVVKEAHRLYPDLEVIVISGYAQFDYAQTAIRYGVGEYLLKPINRDALNHSLEKMAERCRARQTHENTLETLRVNRDDDRQQLRAKLITDLQSGNLEADSAEQFEHAYHFATLSDAYQVVLLKLDYQPEEMSAPSLTIVRAKVRDALEPVLEGNCTDSVIDFIGDCMTCVINYPQCRQETLRLQLRNSLNQLVAQRGIFGQIEFSLALGTLCARPAALVASYHKGQQVLAERLMEGTGRMLEGEPGRSGLLEMDFQSRYTIAIAHAVEVMNPEEADAAVDLLKDALAVPGARGWELQTLVGVAGIAFMARLDAAGSEQVLEAFRERCGLCSTVDGLFACLRRLQREQMEQTEQRLRDRDAQPIRNAKLYIRKNFARPITLEEVSAAIGFSVNYFSTLFKKETGEGFAKYLARVRMDEARAMLRETAQPVAEICRSVGYGDLKHFTHSFKAETGLTPGEYRKLYG